MMLSVGFRILLFREIISITIWSSQAFVNYEKMRRAFLLCALLQ